MPNGHEPATKQDLLELRAELKADMQELRVEVKNDVQELRAEVKADMHELRAEVKADMQGLRTEMQAMGDHLVESMRDIQTELLKAFYSFTESNRQRVSQLEGNQATLIARVGTLEDRVLELERRINFPNHPKQ
jgi:hypothetical protein